MNPRKKTFRVTTQFGVFTTTAYSANHARRIIRFCKFRRSPAALKYIHEWKVEEVAKVRWYVAAGKKVYNTIIKRLKLCRG